MFDCGIACTSTDILPLVCWPGRVCICQLTCPCLCGCCCSGGSSRLLQAAGSSSHPHSLAAHTAGCHPYPWPLQSKLLRPKALSSFGLAVICAISISVDMSAVRFKPITYALSCCSMQYAPSVALDCLCALCCCSSPILCSSPTTLLILFKAYASLV